MQSALQKLSAHLCSQAPDTLDWADGGGHETARDLLESLSAKDWDELFHTWRQQSKEWRTCLAEILTPQNPTASAMLLDMALDADIDVSFSALCGVAFYCGINRSSDGSYFDERICVPEFLAVAQSHAEVASHVERIMAQCSDHYSQQFKLLASQLRRGGPKISFEPKLHRGPA